MNKEKSVNVTIRLIAVDRVQFLLRHSADVCRGVSKKWWLHGANYGPTCRLVSKQWNAVMLCD